MELAVIGTFFHSNRKGQPTVQRSRTNYTASAKRKRSMPSRFLRVILVRGPCQIIIFPKRVQKSSTIFGSPVFFGFFCAPEKTPVWLFQGTLVWKTSLYDQPSLASWNVFTTICNKANLPKCHGAGTSELDKFIYEPRVYVERNKMAKLLRKVVPNHAVDMSWGNHRCLPIGDRLQLLWGIMPGNALHLPPRLLRWFWNRKLWFLGRLTEPMWMLEPFERDTILRKLERRGLRSSQSSPYACWRHWKGYADCSVFHVCLWLCAAVQWNSEHWAGPFLRTFWKIHIDS